MVALMAPTLSGCRQLWEQPSVHPYEEPQLQPASGTVPVDAPAPLTDLTSLKNPIKMTSETISAGHLAYRRYCHQCHGLNLDGDATVGPSLPDAQMNLLLPRVAAMSDGEIFSAIWAGTKSKRPAGGTSDTAQSAIRNPRSGIRNPQSGIGNSPWSVLWTPPEPAVSPPLAGTMTTTDSWHVVIYVRAKQAGVTGGAQPSAVSGQQPAISDPPSAWVSLGLSSGKSPSAPNSGHPALGATAPGGQ